jgi:hypothetical protein
VVPGLTAVSLVAGFLLSPLGNGLSDRFPAVLTFI